MSKTDRNGNLIVGDILDLIDKNNNRYAVALAVAEYIKSRYISKAEVRVALSTVPSGVDETCHRLMGRSVTKALGLSEKETE